MDCLSQEFTAAFSGRLFSCLDAVCGAVRDVGYVCFLLCTVPCLWLFRYLSSPSVYSCGACPLYLGYTFRCTHSSLLRASGLCHCLVLGTEITTVLFAQPETRQNEKHFSLLLSQSGFVSPDKYPKIPFQ